MSSCIIRCGTSYRILLNLTYRVHDILKWERLHRLLLIFRGMIPDPLDVQDWGWLTGGRGTEFFSPHKSGLPNGGEMHK